MSRTRLFGMLYVSCSKRFRVQPDTVFLEAHQGLEFFGNPYYIARHILQSDQYQHLHLIIVCPRRSVAKLRQVFAARPVKFCRVRSIRYVFHLATAGFLVNDVTFPPYFSRRAGQKFLNTWHGTPLKALGRRLAHGRFQFISNTQHNFLHATDLLAPNLHTEQVLLQDYMIEKIWSGSVIRGGYPRNDVLFNYSPASAVPGDGAINISFMPTWRGTLSTIGDASRKQIEELKILFDCLEANLPAHVTVWVRLHPLIDGSISFRRYTRLRAFPGDCEPYEHLAKCDALVTDYSSVLFDFAVTRRPVLLYTPDNHSYRQERDFCLDLASLPFETYNTPEELSRRLVNLSQEAPAYSEQLEAFITQYCPHDKGRSTEALCEQFFLGQDCIEVRKVTPDKNRKNILLFGGSFLNNGITTSLKTLLPLIDKYQFNIVLWVYSDAVQINGEEYFQVLDERVDYLPTTDFLSVDPFEALRLGLRDFFARKWAINDRLNRTVWQREWIRKFATAHFDALVHFTGYERGVCLLFAGCPVRKVIFVHNDMASELATGRMSDARALRLAYELADAVAIVRDGAEQPYCLEHYDYSAKKIYVPNTLSLQCRDLAKAPLHEAFRAGVQSPEYADVSQVIDEPGKFRFINVARFSPEKGQVKLIDAFELIWSTDRSVELYIMGGHGVAHKDVLRHARSSAASRSIFIILGSGNPFPVFGRMDAFVLSSNYEGRPLVLYEAFALGIPVISTDIPGPAELLKEGYGLVVENSVEGLVRGMQAALRGEIPQRPYDFEAHNRFALEQFYKAIGA